MGIIIICPSLLLPEKERVIPAKRLSTQNLMDFNFNFPIMLVVFKYAICNILRGPTRLFVHDWGEKKVEWVDSIAFIGQPHIRCSLLTIALLIQASSGAKILAFFPFGGTSHHILFKPWILELCNRGHQVTYLSPLQFAEESPNLEKIAFPDFWKEYIVEANKNWKTSPIWSTIPGTYYKLYGTMLEVARDTLNSPAVTEVLNSNRTYDAVVSEAFFFNEWISVFAHRFQAIHIVFQTFGDHSWTSELSGLPNNPAASVDYLYYERKPLPPSSVEEKLHSLYCQISAMILGYYFINGPQKNMVDELVTYQGSKDRPRLSMMVSDNALILRNAHHSMGSPAPLAPHVKDVGGLNVDFELRKPEVMDLPNYEEFRNFMDDASNGFIYFSMGTQVLQANILPRDAFDKLYSAFSKMRLPVLMRWTGGQVLPFQSPNVKLCDKFLPQMEILGHKNIKLFVTHGGLLSLAETIYFGVPILGLPVFSDQPMNVKRAQAQGFGIHLNIVSESLPETAVVEALNELINNPKYKREAMRRSELFKERPMKPLEEAVYWTEYVLKYGNVMQPASARMAFYEVYMLDVIGALASIVVVPIYVIKILRKIAGKL